MRQYSPESLLWQAVSIDSNGKARLTTLIGEIAGAVRKSFRLPPVQVARLHRLVRDARGAQASPVHNLQAELYSLYIAGQPSEVIEGKMPKRLEALVNYLSGLMLTYCC
jgi:hypothetical protein